MGVEEEEQEVASPPPPVHIDLIQPDRHRGMRSLYQLVAGFDVGAPNGNTVCALLLVERQELCGDNGVTPGRTFVHQAGQPFTCTHRNAAAPLDSPCGVATDYMHGLRAAFQLLYNMDGMRVLAAARVYYERPLLHGGKHGTARVSAYHYCFAAALMALRLTNQSNIQGITDVSPRAAKHVLRAWRQANDEEPTRRARPDGKRDPVDWKSEVVEWATRVFPSGALPMHLDSSERHHYADALLLAANGVEHLTGLPFAEVEVRPAVLAPHELGPRLLDYAYNNVQEPLTVA